MQERNVGLTTKTPGGRRWIERTEQPDRPEYNRAGRRKCAKAGHPSASQGVCPVCGKLWD